MDRIAQDGQWLAAAVRDALQVGRGLAVGKLGTCEFETVLNPGSACAQLYRNAGVWPPGYTTASSWQNHIIKHVLPVMDGVVVWQAGGAEAIERALFQKYAPQAHTIALRALEPYYQADPACMWTQAIPVGTKIAVVTPFAASVAKQVPHLATLFPLPIWPSGLEFIGVRTGCSPCLDTTGPAAWPQDILQSGWQYAVVDIVRRVRASGARVALVGCGGLSLPIVAALKRAGIVAIHTGGATQIMFGIRGRRWDTHSIISTLYNDTWISPSPEETPQNHVAIEGGCYW